MKPGESNNTWIITHCPRPDQGSYLCDICRIAFTFKGTLVRHMNMHSNKTYICPHCNYHSTRVDNIRRHLHTFHKITKTAPQIANLQIIVSSPAKPKDACSAPVKTNKIKTKIYILGSRGCPPKDARPDEHTLSNPDVSRTKKFHTLPVTKPPIRNKLQLRKDTTPPPPSPLSEASLVDLSWLPTALHSSPKKLSESLEQPETVPEPLPELSTPILDSTPISLMKLEQLKKFHLIYKHVRGGYAP